MADTIIREAAIESQRLRDRLEDQNRTASLEKDHAVLKTIVSAFIEEYRARGVSEDDLKLLQRELEAKVQQTFGNVDTLLDDQSEDILGKVEAMLMKYQAKVTQDQLAQSNALLNANAQTRKEIIRYGIGFALTIVATVIAALIVFWLTK